jgi:hypothetical protein
VSIVITLILVIAFIAICEILISFARKNLRLVARLYGLDFADESDDTKSATDAHSGVP